VANRKLPNQESSLKTQELLMPFWRTLTCASESSSGNRLGAVEGSIDPGIFHHRRGA